MTTRAFHADGYRRLSEHLAAGNRQLLSLIDERHDAGPCAGQPRSEQAFYDVACGLGSLSRAASEVGWRTVGLDVSEDQVSAARADAPHLRFEVGDAMALPFGEDSGSVAASVFGIIFADDPSLALRELVRVVRPGGLVAITSWDRSTAARVLREHLTVRVEVELPPLPEIWDTADGVASAMADAGLVDIDVHTARLPFAAATGELAVDGMCDMAPLLGTLRAAAGSRWPSLRAGAIDALRSRGALEAGPDGAMWIDTYYGAIGVVV